MMRKIIKIGLGACIGYCPMSAIAVEEREAQEYDEAKTMENIVKAGENVIRAHLEHLRGHNQDEYLKQALDFLKKRNIKIDLNKKGESGQMNMPKGCPGMKVIDFRGKKEKNQAEGTGAPLSSELGQWPIQLKLLNPRAPYFNDAELVIAADCVPFAYADFHRKFLKGKALIILCPKLDAAFEEYTEKLSEIFKSNNIKSITVAHMEVPCCFGTVQIVEQALKKSGKNIIIKEYNISLQGQII
ncbi:MAG: 4Fe-4S ferredoxin [Candidatus Omnitrophica bacterium]|nr:4Fe-4S ferredoxin [Candidatus Omnitrophota bacterium]